jgi:methyl coenzyme M reductase alpha subunit
VAKQKCKYYIRRATKVAKEEKIMGKGMKVAFISGGVVIVALLVTVIILLVKGNGAVRDEVKRNVVVNSNNAEQVAEQLINEQYVAPGYYSTQMSTTWHFATGYAVSEDAYVKNDAGNTNDVFFDVFLASDENEPILQSPVIPRGSEMTDISLEKKLDAGTYDCVMVYHLIDENQNTVSTLRVAFTIIIEQ